MATTIQNSFYDPRMDREALLRRKARRRLCEELAEHLQDDQFMIEVVMWAWERCEKFEFGDPTTWEHSLVFTEMHKEYRELYEKRAEAFLEQNNLTEGDFLVEVKEYLEKEDDDTTKGLLDALTASEEYLPFCKFMQRVRHRREWAEGMGYSPTPMLGAGDGEPPENGGLDDETLDEEEGEESRKQRGPEPLQKLSEKPEDEQLGSAKWGPASAPHCRSDIGNKENVTKLPEIVPPSPQKMNLDTCD